MTQARWLNLDGADNVRDLGGLPTSDGGVVAPARLLRSDSLQALSDADVRYLVDDLRLRAVADLRSGVEVAAEGPGPLTKEPAVTVRHLSLFAEGADPIADDDSGPVLLPWQQDETRSNRPTAIDAYLGYLQDRPDSILAALRLIAHTDGATIVHCAAGKDRTGLVVAFALAEVGVPTEEIVADYARSADRVAAVFTRLATRRTYANDVNWKRGPQELDRHKPKAETMRELMTAMAQRFGGVSSWLRSAGWTEADAAALRSHLVESRGAALGARRP